VRPLRWQDSGPQSENKREQHELRGVISGVDEPHEQAAIGELVVDAETGADKANAGNGMMPRRSSR